MEPVSMTLGAIVVGVLAKAQERVATRAVDGGENIVHRLTERLRASFSDHEEGQRALRGLERAPSSSSSLAALAAAIDDKVEGDADLQTWLSAWVEEARSGSGAAHFVTQVDGGARVGTIVNIGQARDVTL